MEWVDCFDSVKWTGWFGFVEKEKHHLILWIVWDVHPEKVLDHANRFFPLSLLVIEFLPRDESITHLMTLDQEEFKCIWFFYSKKNFTFG